MKRNEQSKNFILTGADGGTLYTLTIAIPLIISVIFSIILISTGLNANEKFVNGNLYVYLSFAITSLSLLTVILYTRKKNSLDLVTAISIKKCEPKYYLIALCLAFGSLFGLGWLNDAFISFLQQSGFHISEINLPKEGFGNYILCVIIVCVLPALFEESIFRGLLLNGARRGGDIFAIVLCGLLFSLYHKNPAQTVYQFILGMALTLLALKSGSLLPSILFHFINNLYVVTFHFLTPTGYTFDKWVQIILCVLGIIAFALAVVYLFVKCEKPKYDCDLDSDYQKISSKKEERKFFVLFAVPCIIATLIFWAFGLF